MRYGGDSICRPSTSRYHATAASTSGTQTAVCARAVITADRSPMVREEARARDVQVLNKPLKPAALRALIAQWRVQRMAAAE